MSTNRRNPYRAWKPAPLSIYNPVDNTNLRPSGPTIISPRSAQVNSLHQMSTQLNSQLNPQVNAQVNAQVNPQVNAQVSAQVNAQVNPQVSAQVNSQVNAQRTPQVSQVISQVTPQARSIPQTPAQKGPDLWKQLHSRALEYPKLGLNNDNDFINRWSSQVPNFGGCSCKSFWTTWKNSNPPDYRNYFEWTVRAHNAVNSKLNKSSISVDQARTLYS
jgi:hypothetical protein